LKSHFGRLGTREYRAGVELHDEIEVRRPNERGPSVRPSAPRTFERQPGFEAVQRG
jgi:hypothetical protein